MPLPIITAEDLKLALVDAFIGGDPADLHDVAHCVTVLPASEVASALLASARYARTMRLRVES
jgi:hypothetical protein